MENEIEKLLAIKDDHKFVVAIRDYVFKQGLKQNYLNETDSFHRE